jgi:flavin-dependent dehydrogenase
MHTSPRTTHGLGFAGLAAAWTAAGAGRRALLFGRDARDPKKFMDQINDVQPSP